MNRDSNATAREQERLKEEDSTAMNDKTASERTPETYQIDFSRIARVVQAADAALRDSQEPITRVNERIHQRYSGYYMPLTQQTAIRRSEFARDQLFVAITDALRPFL